jgi:hypothetical protein
MMDGYGMIIIQINNKFFNIIDADFFKTSDVISRSEASQQMLQHHSAHEPY